MAGCWEWRDNTQWRAYDAVTTGLLEHALTSGVAVVRCGEDRIRSIKLKIIKRVLSL